MTGVRDAVGAPVQAENRDICILLDHDSGQGGAHIDSHALRSLLGSVESLAKLLQELFSFLDLGCAARARHGCNSVGSCSRVCARGSSTTTIRMLGTFSGPSIAANCAATTTGLRALFALVLTWYMRTSVRHATVSLPVTWGQAIVADDIVVTFAAFVPTACF